MAGVDYGHAVYAGSFDPITIGHLAIIERASRIHERVTVAVGVNPNKAELFSQEERKNMVTACVADTPGLEVATFDGLLVEFARSVDAGVLIRGLRLLADFEHEFQLALANRELAPELETVFLMTESEHLHVSSSLVKEIAKNRGDLRGFVPSPVEHALRTKLGITKR
jgi:pantetheine-phosphate adenylyltransferase